MNFRIVRTGGGSRVRTSSAQQQAQGSRRGFRSKRWGQGHVSAAQRRSETSWELWEALKVGPFLAQFVSILGMNQTAEDSSRAVFTARMVVMERPEIAEEMSRRAAASGRSLAAEVRAPIRYWLDGWGAEGG